MVLVKREKSWAGSIQPLSHPSGRTTFPFTPSSCFQDLLTSSGNYKCAWLMQEVVHKGYVRWGPNKILEYIQVLFLLAAAVGKLWLNAHRKDNMQSVGSGAGEEWCLFHWSLEYSDSALLFQYYLSGLQLPLSPASSLVSVWGLVVEGSWEWLEISLYFLLNVLLLPCVFSLLSHRLSKLKNQ